MSETGTHPPPSATLLRAVIMPVMAPHGQRGLLRAAERERDEPAATGTRLWAIMTTPLTTQAFRRARIFRKQCPKRL
jgi:hypothetical protein